MKVFLAGASGVIGRQLIPLLTQAGHQVTGITRSQEKLASIRQLGAEAIVCDIYDSPGLHKIMRELRPHAIINELTDLPNKLTAKLMAEHYARTNLLRQLGTQNLLAAAQHAGVKRFITQSVAFWYATQGDWIKDETTSLQLNAREPIGGAVRALQNMESMVLSQSDLTGIVLRYGYFYGPGTWYSRTGYMGNLFLERRYPIIGEGKAVSSFIHIQDAATATVAALEKADAGIYNVVDNEPAAATAWMPIMADALGAPTPARIPPFLARLAIGSALAERAQHQRGASNAKIKSAFGWQPRYASWRQGFYEALE